MGNSVKIQLESLHGPEVDATNENFVLKLCAAEMDSEQINESMNAEPGQIFKQKR